MKIFFQQLILLAILSAFIVSTPLHAEVPAEAKEAMGKGYEAAKQKDYLSAILHFEQAQEIAPESPDIYYNLGLAE